MVDCSSDISSKQHSMLFLCAAVVPLWDSGMVWIAVLHERDHAVKNLFFQSLCHPVHIGIRRDVGVMEQERNIGAMPCRLAGFHIESMSKKYE